MKGFNPKQKHIFLSNIMPLDIFLWIILGSLLYAVGLHFFLFPYDISLGGVGGISVILAQYLPISPGILLSCINYSLLLLAFLVLGKTFALRTMVGSLITTAIINVLEVSLPMQMAMVPNVWCAGIMGAVLAALGSAILFNCDSSSGGTDIIALIIQKFSRIKIGTALLISDIVLVAMLFFIFDNIQIAYVSIICFFSKIFGINYLITRVRI